MLRLAKKTVPPRQPGSRPPSLHLKAPSGVHGRGSAVGLLPPVRDHDDEVPPGPVLLCVRERPEDEWHLPGVSGSRSK